MRPHEMATLILATAAVGCGSAERKAAEARADSLQRVLQHQQDSLKGASVMARHEDSLKAAQATVAKRRADSVRAARDKAVADSISAERARPHDLAIMNTTGVTIGPQKYANYAFVLDSAADCTVHGKIETLSGGEKRDVEVYLLSADDFTNWRNHQTVAALFQSPRQTVTTLNTGITQSGGYHLVVSNYFSSFSSKTVRGQVTVTCRGLQPRQP